MPERQRGMGRGLSAILSVAPREESEELRQLPLELVSANPHQPRDTFDEAALVALAESIKVRGVLQPVLVRPLPGGTYELIAGERRWRAAQLAGLETVPAIVRHHDDAASLEVALVENMAREDLNPVEEARACAALTEELGLSREDVGRRVGRTRGAGCAAGALAQPSPASWTCPTRRSRPSRAASSARATAGRSCSLPITATAA